MVLRFYPQHNKNTETASEHRVFEGRVWLSKAFDVINKYRPFLSVRSPRTRSLLMRWVSVFGIWAISIHLQWAYLSMLLLCGPEYWKANWKIRLGWIAYFTAQFKWKQPTDKMAAFFFFLHFFKLNISKCFKWWSPSQMSLVNLGNTNELARVLPSCCTNIWSLVYIHLI